MASGYDVGNINYSEWKPITTGQMPQNQSFGNAIEPPNPAIIQGDIALERTPNSDEYQFNSAPSNKQGEVLEKNKGFLNKVKHFFTGKDYYKSSTGIKISTKKNTGNIIEGANGEVYISGAEKVKIKGTKNDDTILVNSSNVKFIKGKKGNDNIVIENSKVKKIYGNSGQDVIEVYNSYVKSIKGGSGDDNIYTWNSKTKKINGQGGRDTVYTDGGHTKKVKSTSRDNVTINNNPLNPNPNIHYA